jgi:choice-of-anchor I-like protein
MTRASRLLFGCLIAWTVAGLSADLASSPETDIVLTPLGAYDTPFFDEGAVEIAAYDAVTRRAFLTFAARPRIDIVDLSDPAAPFLTQTIDLTPWGADAHTTSVAVHSGVVAAALPQGIDDTGPGKVLFFDVYGNYVNGVTVGALPDMITFTPNGQLLLTANEGQPRDDYSLDPEGSVSIIDMRGGAAALTQADVTTAGFAAFNAPAVIDSRIRVFGPGASVAQDLEPEYIAVSHDSLTAWVTLQENNALAILDLKSKTVTSLVALGYKDHSVAGRGLDGSIDSKETIRPWPVLGMYQPDGIATVHRAGSTYLVTANEGDVREYAGLNAPKPSDKGLESIRVGELTLDPALLAAFPGIQNNTTGIGRLNVTSFHGDTNGDGKFDKLYAFGARSFSVWSAAGALLWDSGEQLERITAAAFPSNFNASNTSNAVDNRSDDKGPEPEGITVARLFGRDYVFVSLERIGGVAVYDINTPTSPRFVQYINPRNFGAAPSSPASGDQGPEGLVVVESSANGGSPLLLVANEVSGTLRVYRIEPSK